jgi:hypothetical protein
MPCCKEEMHQELGSSVMRPRGHLPKQELLGVVEPERRIVIFDVILRQKSPNLRQLILVVDVHGRPFIAGW